MGGDLERFQGNTKKGVALASASLVLALAAGGAQAQSAWKPERPVELIATNAPGGGSDRILRIMVKILQERRYVPTPVAVVAEAVAAILGGVNSRFYWNIVQEGLSPRAGVFREEYHDTGVLSMFALGVLFVAYTVQSCRVYWMRLRRDEPWLIGLGSFAGVAGYLAAAAFNDSVVSVAPVFWVMLGMGMSTLARSTSSDPGLRV